MFETIRERLILAILDIVRILGYLCSMVIVSHDTVLFQYVRICRTVIKKYVSNSNISILFFHIRNFSFINSPTFSRRAQAILWHPFPKYFFFLTSLTSLVTGPGFSKSSDTSKKWDRKRKENGGWPLDKASVHSIWKVKMFVCNLKYTSYNNYSCLCQTWSSDLY